MGTEEIQWRGWRERLEGMTTGMGGGDLGARYKLTAMENQGIYKAGWVAKSPSNWD